MNKTLLIIILVFLFLVPVASHSEHEGIEHNTEFNLLDKEVSNKDKAAYTFLLSALISSVVVLKFGKYIKRHFDGLFTLGILWFAFGAVADAYNHLNGAPITFFNLQHSIMYSGATVITFLLGFMLFRGYRSGKSLTSNIPNGYELTLISPPIFLIAGIGDMFWHRIFGFEEKAIEMASPFHILLGLAGIFLISGPLRHAWYTGTEKTWKKQLPMLTSTAGILTVTTFMFQHFHPYSFPFSAAWFTVETGTAIRLGMLGISGMVLHTIMLLAVTLRLLKKFDIVKGGLTSIFIMNAVVMTSVNGTYIFILPAALTGILAEIFYQRFSVSTEAPLKYRLFAFGIPIAMNGLYFLTVHINGGIAWSVHSWAGFTFMTGCIGALTSYVVEPDLSGRATA